MKWDRKNFQDRMQQEGIQILYWGRYGKDALLDLEQQLNFKFDKETASFIEEIGNVTIGSYEIIIAGDELGQNSCMTKSKRVGLVTVESVSGLKIMESAGLNFILYRNGSIQSYEHLDFEPEYAFDTYISLSCLVESLIQASK